MEHLLAWLNEQRGRRVDLARRLGILPSALSQWSQVPADRVIAVERVTGIPRHVLRPDLAQIFAEQPTPKREGEAAA